MQAKGSRPSKRNDSALVLRTKGGATAKRMTCARERRGQPSSGGAVSGDSRLNSIPGKHPPHTDPPTLEVLGPVSSFFDGATAANLDRLDLALLAIPGGDDGDERTLGGADASGGEVMLEFGIVKDDDCRARGQRRAGRDGKRANSPSPARGSSTSFSTEALPLPPFSMSSTIAP